MDQSCSWPFKDIPTLWPRFRIPRGGPLCSAAAVVSDFRQAPVKIPCSQERVSNTNGTPWGRRPPKMIASMGTPSEKCKVKVRKTW